VRDGIPIAAAIVAGFVLLSAVVLYSENRIERRLQASVQIAQPGVAPRELDSAPTQATSVRVNADGIRVDRVMTYDFFARYWRPDFAHIADRDCWLPLEKGKKLRLPSQVHFDLEVDADGSVIEVHEGVVDDPADNASELRTCLAKIIRTMKFAPSGKRQRGLVQADRPMAN
jgi:hypothetical protein